jgi:hypothetical protein
LSTAIESKRFDDGPRMKGSLINQIDKELVNKARENK